MRQIIEKSICIGFVALNLFSLLTPQLALNERYINPKGWNLPDPACLALVKAEKMAYPGIPFEITAEIRQAELEQLYYIKNPLFMVGESFRQDLFVKEEVCALTIYRKRDGEILCYRYVRLLEGLVPGSQPEAAKSPPSSMIIDGVQISYVFDLDNDGINESMIHAPYKQAEELRLLISIIKCKLGIAQFVEDRLMPSVR
jgi:hypothetical protein